MAPLNAPSSDATVDVHIMHPGNVSMPASMFLTPVLPGHERLNAPVLMFLVKQRGQGGRQILFDLGMRKDVEGFSPAVRKGFEAGGGTVDIPKDASDLLREAGVKLESIDTVIWSHSHLDHTGDMSKLPGSTELVFGPGTTEHHLPPYPQREDSRLVESDIAGRKVTEVSFDKSDLKIGGFKALDFFGDGSFYLLDLPGHIIGHMAGLARTTPTTFVLMGADTCHHPGLLRPSPGILASTPCPGALLCAPISREHFPGDFKERTKALLDIPPEGTLSVHENRQQALHDIHGVATYFDSSEDVIVLLAHDPSIEGAVDFFPAKLNDWKAKGLKGKLAWRFLETDNKGWRFDVKA